MTIEDETGVANLVIFENLFDKYRKEILQSKLIMAEGRLQIQGEVIHVIVTCLYDFSKLMRNLTASNIETTQVSTLARPDEKSIPPGLNKKGTITEKTEKKIFPVGRNFR